MVPSIELSLLRSFLPAGFGSAGSQHSRSADSLLSMVTSQRISEPHTSYAQRNPKTLLGIMGSDELFNAVEST
jgi:hypothetical protein